MEPTAPMPFTPEMDAAFAKAKAKLDPARLKQLLFDLTNIHSPTGATREIVEFVAGHMEKIGLKPTLDPMTEISANILGERRGMGGAPPCCSIRRSTPTSKVTKAIFLGLAQSNSST